MNQSIYINPRSERLDDGKEQVFWHLTSRENKRQVRQGNRWVWVSEGRFPDFARTERIEWVKQILVNHDHPSSYFIIRKVMLSVIFVFIFGHISMTLWLFCRNLDVVVLFW